MSATYRQHFRTAAPRSERETCPCGPGELTPTSRPMWRSVVAQGADRIEAGGTPGGHPAGEDRDGRDRCDGARDHQRIVAAHLVQLAGQQPRDGQRARDAETQADSHQADTALEY